MSNLTTAELEEYAAFMNARADEASLLPDPTPEDLGQWDVSEEEEEYWAQRADMEDRYLDSSWEDRFEMF